MNGATQMCGDTSATLAAVVTETQALRALRALRLWQSGRPPMTEFVQFGIEVRGPITADEVEEAVRVVITRHDALRTVFTFGDGVQAAIVPVEGISFRLERQDVHAVDRAERTALLEQHLETLASRPVDPGRAPLLRAKLCRFGEHDAVLLVAVEHIVFDGQSIRLFREDLADVLRGDPGSLRPSPQFSTWARRQLSYVDSADGLVDLGFWRDAFTDVKPFPELGLPTPTPPTPAHGWHEETAILETAVVLSLRRAVSRTATPFMAVMAAVSDAWCRVTGSEWAVLHVPSDNRGDPDADRVIGWLAHTLILPMRPVDWRTWRHAVLDTRAAVLAALTHQTIPFARIIREVQPECYGVIPAAPRLYCDYQPRMSESTLIPRGELKPLLLADSPPVGLRGLFIRVAEIDGDRLSIGIGCDPAVVAVAFVKDLAAAVAAALSTVATGGLDQPTSPPPAPN